MIFKNKIVWITGASSGIGQALSLEFAKKSAIIILSSRNKKKLKDVARKCEILGAETHIQILDLEQQENFSEICKTVIAKYKRIDILINNGGISQRSFAKETPLEIDKKIMEIDYFGNIALTKAVLPYMLEQQSGTIVTTSSIAGKFGVPKRSAYCAAKHALHGFYETLRAELKADNIQILIAIPGFVKTNISYNAILNDGSTNNKLDNIQAGGVSVSYCAKKIIRGIQKKKKEVFIGGKELSMVYIRKFLPFVYYHIIDKVKST